MNYNKRPDKRLEIEIKGFGNFVHPHKSKRGSIGYDLAIPEDVLIPAHSRIVVSLNFAINLPPNYEAKIEPRSGFSAKGIEGIGSRTTTTYKFGIIPYRKVQSGKLRFDADVITGKVDPNYKDSVGVIIRNNDEQFLLRKGTRIAQMTIYRTTPVRWRDVDTLNCDNRGGGFGSSGVGMEETNQEPSTQE